MTIHLVRRLVLVGLAGVWLCLLPLRSEAQVDVRIGIQLPPPLVFSAPPQVVVLPGTYVYVVPDIEEDVFFFDGWWWRPWQGHWYRSRSYERGWSHYEHAPSFYREVPQDWRHAYRERQWGGRGWNYEPVPHDRVEKNWNAWKRERYWEKHQTWGVQGWESPRHDQGHGSYPQSKQRGEQPHAEQPQSHDRSPQAEKHPSKKSSGSHAGHDQGSHGQGHGKSSKQHDGKKGK